MQINNIDDMYVAELQELFSMEGQLADALHKMAEVASHPFSEERFIASRRRHAGPKAKT